MFKIGYYVYRFLNSKNEVIYVGKTRNLITRIRGHRHLEYSVYIDTHKIEYVEFKTNSDMDFAEKYYIMRFNPEYCIAHGKKRLTISLSDLDDKEWTTVNTEISWLRD